MMVTKEGGIQFPNGKKPESLIQRILEMSSEPGDLILDSFLGSGTTAAVAHKMRRRWIGIEMGDQAYTHCKVRLDKIINGEDRGGITEDTMWSDGGGYHFYELAPTLINVDLLGEPIINKEYNPDMLAAAVALHEGFKYCPNPNVFWKQSVSTENSYLFVTTAHLTDLLVKEIEKQIGRGLRLPYGKRTGEKEIDSVTMTAHANFTNVINDAKRGDSIFKKEHIIYVEDIDKPKEAYSQTKLDLEFGNDNHIETTINKVLEERPDVERNDVVENIVRKITSHVEEVVKANKGNGLIENRKEIEGKVSNRIITDTDIAEKAQEGQLDSDFITRIFTTSIDQYVKVVENNTIAIPKLVEKFDGDVTSFKSDKVQNALRRINQDVLFIADEVHNFGAEGLRNSLINSFKLMLV